jgi:hypothetical protein
MSDEPCQVRRKALRRVAIGAVLLVVLAILAFLAYVPIRSTQVMREFGILWNTTDAIQRRGAMRAEGGGECEIGARSAREQREGWTQAGHCFAPGWGLGAGLNSPFSAAASSGTGEGPACGF